MKFRFLWSKSSGLQRKHTPAPSPPPPHRAVQEAGEKWIFSSTSRSSVYGYEAWISVNIVQVTKFPVGV
jgi:hypothetical protein